MPRCSIPALLASALVLIGCATSYEETLRSGYVYRWESTRRPAEAAGCIVGRVHAQRPWRASQRVLNEGGAVELRIGTGGADLTAVARVMPSPYGSTVESWITSRAVLTRDILHDQFFGGC